MWLNIVYSNDSDKIILRWIKFNIFYIVSMIMETSIIFAQMSSFSSFTLLMERFTYTFTSRFLKKNLVIERIKTLHKTHIHLKIFRTLRPRSRKSIKDVTNFPNPGCFRLCSNVIAIIMQIRYIVTNLLKKRWNANANKVCIVSFETRATKASFFSNAKLKSEKNLSNIMKHCEYNSSKSPWNNQCSTINHFEQFSHYAFNEK